MNVDDQLAHDEVAKHDAYNPSAGERVASYCPLLGPARATRARFRLNTGHELLHPSGFLYTGRLSLESRNPSLLAGVPACIPTPDPV